ncbi:ricin-type beta-trefoil lectin domain protein [Catenulispora rubra]|uniref:ricin-type beta-trefoil lectin domain protein n=1 Tax=Catenulispora rubra TaxID=280293 RepID=UPI0018924B16|nr:ricin-type beta-trefoil lectin domain protein [Catenulispora rubra]
MTGWRRASRDRRGPSRAVAVTGAAVVLAVTITAAAPVLQTAVASPAAVAAAAGGPWVLSTTDSSANYAPTFIGNGYLAARVPAEGTGFSPFQSTYTQSELAGFYATPAGAGNWPERRANLPTWTTLGFVSGADGFGNLPVCVFDEACEAAAGQLSGGAIVAHDASRGSTSDAFIDGLGPVGATVTVPITQAGAGAASVRVRYANGNSGSGTVSYRVNGGALQQITLPSTGQWGTWGTVTVPATLVAGTNAFAVTVAPGDTGQVTIDTVAAYPVSGTPPTVVAQLQQGTKSNYSQKLDMGTGTLTTSFTWTAPSGKVTDFTYTVNADRGDGHVGMVTMAATPHWSGTATVVDALDGRGLNYATAASPSVDGASGTLTENVLADGTGVNASIASVLRVGGSATTTTAVAAGYPAQSTSLTVQSGTTYTATKYVGIAASDDTDRGLSAATPQAYALSAATAAASLGAARVTARNNQAWSTLWSADISVPGDDALTGQIRASMFYLLESVRAGVSWSTTPGGLSADGYKGHVFWDMETWMYPALLAGHPDIAAGIDAYRQRLLKQAEQNTSICAPSGQTISGARFPWESALTGKDTYLGPGEFCDEIHITADVALAQWQYYLATGDTSWLANSAWPVLRDAAKYWASRAVPNGSGGYQILNVMGPDEYQDNVNDSAYTNAAAQKTLQIAVQAAQITGNTPDANWAAVAAGLSVPFDAAGQHHLEFDGYSGQTVKQADVTMLQYPWGVPMSSTVAQNDLDYYGARTDLNGPSMTDAIDGIDSSALASSRCDSYTYLQRSINPFMRAPFDQFTETRGGGAFDFTTGAGGFLQEFEYGFTGLRWNQNSLQLDPSLPPQLPGLNLTGLQWQGRTYDLAIGQTGTTLTLTAGSPMPVSIAGGTVQTVASGSTLTMATRRPAGSPDAAQCKTATASSADPSYPAAAAVDGNPATAWHATAPGANLTVDLGTATPLTHVQVVSDGSTTAYSIQGSNDNSTWSTLAGQSASSATTTTVTFPTASYRYLRYQAASGATPQIAGLSAVAHAGPITGYAGLCVDARGGSAANDTPVEVYTCNGGNGQQWTVASDGTVQSLGKCLDVHFGATANGTLVQLYTCNGTSAQQWRAQTDGSLINPQSGRCLDDTGFGGSGTQLEIWDCNSGTNQKWNLP